jgi:hypothetical protein
MMPKACQGAEIEVGDAIFFGNRSHVITRIDPYGGTRGGPGWRVAFAEDDWHITLTPEAIYEVIPK